MPESFGSDFKRFFLRGLAAVLPTLITLMILIWIFTFVNDYLGKYVNIAIQWIVVQSVCIFRHLPMSIKGASETWKSVEGNWDLYHLSWLGFVLGFVVIYIIGRFVASFLGRGVWRIVERTFFRTPVIRQVYPYVKQVTDFLFTERRMDFSRVVAVEYPRKGIWSVGLVTSSGMTSICDAAKADMLTVFIPSSPTPVTGYTIAVPRDEVVDLPISIDNALRYTISAGVIMPLNQQPRIPDGETIRSRLAAPEEPNGKESAE